MFRLIPVFMALILTISIPSQARDWFPDIFGSNEEGVNVWEAGHQYIRIVAQEKSAETENDHPKEITVETLKDALGAVNLQETGGIFSDEVVENSFFSQSDISILSSGLSRAFERAKPTEDIIFVVIGRHKGFIGKERKVIGGRAFIQGGKINLIFGDVYRPEGGSKEQRNRNMAAGCGGCDDNDIRTSPYIIGNRDKEHKVKLAFADLDGLEVARSDWLILDIDKIVAGVEKERNKLPPALARQQARAKKEAAQLNLERRQMREEMARMRKEMGAVSGGKASRSQSLEERLATLDQLKKKGLVSDKEYQIKREEILSDI